MIPTSVAWVGVGRRARLTCSVTADTTVAAAIIMDKTKTVTTIEELGNGMTVTDETDGTATATVGGRTTAAAAATAAAAIAAVPAEAEAEAAVAAAVMVAAIAAVTFKGVPAPPNTSRTRLHGYWRPCRLPCPRRQHLRHHRSCQLRKLAVRNRAAVRPPTFSGHSSRYKT